MVMKTDPYVRRLRLDGLRKCLVIILNPGACPNEQLSRMYGRQVLLIDDRHPLLRKLLFWLYSALRMVNAPVVYPVMQSGHTPDFYKVWQDGIPVMMFRDEEIRKGQQLRKKLGMSSDSQFVCLGLREDAYYQQFLTPALGFDDPNHEAREDAWIRNPPLSNYVPVAKWIAGQECYVLRMGATVGEPITISIPRVIDYATRFRTPFGDIYLLAHCKFVVSGGSAGLWCVTSAFNQPVVITDHYDLSHVPPRPSDLFIPTKLWVTAESRFLTFREMLEFGNWRQDYQGMSRHKYYSYRSNCLADGVELTRNTPEEILTVVQEMHQRLDGRWQQNDEDDYLQRRYSDLYTKEHEKHIVPGRIGADFLRNNQDLLD